MTASKERELESCETSRATCNSDKLTIESRLLNAETKCANEKDEIQDNEQDVCNELLLTKEQLITAERQTAFSAGIAAVTFEQLAFGFGLLALAMIMIFAFLGFTGRIKL
jgi:hypothetical protein